MNVAADRELTQAEVFKILPCCAVGNYDQFTHKKISDLVWLCQHELDLHEEGEQRLRHTQVQALKRFIQKHKA